MSTPIEHSPSSTLTVLHLESARYHAMARSDIETLRELLDDDLVYTHSSGHRDSKQSYLDAVEAGAFRYKPISHSELVTFAEGDVTVLIGEMHTDAIIHGRAKRLSNASISVWRASESGPRLIALQTTPLPEV